MINNFASDNTWISEKWLLWLIDGRGLKVKHLLQVNHLGTGTSHHLAILKDGHYICDCCMGLNLGIPCRHYFQILTKVQGMKFNVGLVHARYEFSLFFRCNDWLLPLYLLRYRWYQDPTKVDLSVIPPVSLEHCATATKAESSDHAIPVVGPLLCNPLERNLSQSSQWPTDTVPISDGQGLPLGKIMVTPTHTLGNPYPQLWVWVWQGSENPNPYPYP